MKKIGQLLRMNKKDKKMVLDEKTIFYIFSKIIKEEYGQKGSANFTPVVYKARKLIIRCQSSSWRSELWLNRKEIIRKINREIGNNEVTDIKVNT